MTELEKDVITFIEEARKGKRRLYFATRNDDIPIVKLLWDYAVFFNYDGDEPFFQRAFADLFRGSYIPVVASATDDRMTITVNSVFSDSIDIAVAQIVDGNLVWCEDERSAGKTSRGVEIGSKIIHKHPLTKRGIEVNPVNEMFIRRMSKHGLTYALLDISPTGEAA